MSDDSTIERISIPWLHIIRKHPIFCKNYSSLFTENYFHKTLFSVLYRTAKNKVRWLKYLWDGLLFSLSYKDISSEIDFKVDYLFVSHLVNEKQFGQNEDFYFGDLPNELTKENFNSLIVLIDHTGKVDSLVSKKWNACFVPRIILKKSLGMFDEIKLYVRLNRESSRIRKLKKGMQSDLYSAVVRRASEEVFSSGARQSLSIGVQIEGIIKQVNPKVIIVTYEGYAWERVVFSSARKIDPKIKCVAYQHAAIFNHQHAIRRRLTSEFNPDVILTSGLISKQQFELNSDFNDLEINILGSNRILKVINNSKKNKAFCLVLPEGIESECHLLFDFTIVCAKKLPDIHFILRLHPIVNINSLLVKNPKLKKLPCNVSFSNQEFDVDILKSSWAIYRGSTAIIQAVCNGLRPLYLNASKEMIVDPLYALDAWKVILEKPQDVKMLIDNDKNITDFEFNEEVDIAKSYCSNFYVPFNCNVLSSLTCVQE